MKKILLFLCAIFFATGAYSTGISANDTTANCDNNTLGQTSGTANVEIDWVPNAIDIHWYDEAKQLSGPSSCVYDDDLYLPAKPTKTGYTFKGWTVVSVPNEYTELKYIQSDGNQYIDTGLTVNGNTDISVDLQLLSIIAGRYIFGSFTYDNTRRNYFLWTAGTSSGNVQYQFGWHSSYTNFSTVDTSRHLIQIYNDGHYAYLDIDGVNIGRLDNAPSMPESHHTFTLFRGYQESIFTGIPQKMYRAVIKQNKNVVMTLIPVKRNSDNVVGMYDTVSGTFFTNLGTGTFTAGPAVMVPSTYTQLEYLQSDGNQYIDTGLIVNGDTDVSVDLQLLETPGTRYVFGSYTSSAQYFLYLASGGSAYQFGWHSPYNNFGTVDKDRHIIRLHNDGSYAYMDIDGTNVGRLNNSSSQASSNHTFTLFQGYEEYMRPGVAQKIYGTIIKQNNDLIRRLIPAKRNSDNVLGMYDTVTGQFFINSGTGSFIAGPAVQ
jgi:hypothetical protein